MNNLERENKSTNLFSSKRWSVAVFSFGLVLGVVSTPLIYSHFFKDTAFSDGNRLFRDIVYFQKKEVEVEINKSNLFLADEGDSSYRRTGSRNMMYRNSRK
ncbi:MAG: hypothetical protein ACRBDI_09100 [Alphaproteobacteria bacterium]